jgi:hypothetical protein
VTHNIVVLAQQFGLAKAADLNESTIGVGDAAFHIGLGHDGIDRVDNQLVGGNRQIDLHLM